MRPTCTGARPPTPRVAVWQGLHSLELGPDCLPDNLCTFRGRAGGGIPVYCPIHSPCVNGGLGTQSGHEQGLQ